MFYFILTVPVAVVYWMDRTKDRELPLTSADSKLIRWFDFQLPYQIFVILSYMVFLGVVTKFPRHVHRLFPGSFTLILMVKVIYYVWAFAGGCLYFSEVRNNEDSEY